jgi:uncharacterized phage-associated protein
MYKRIYAYTTYGGDIYMTSVVNIANYILQIAKRDTEEEEYELISHMKLQKLIYYCQGFNLAFYDTPLFPEPIEAWKHGPVCPNLYHELKYCGSAPVSVIGSYEDRLTGNEKELIEQVYAKYGQYSAGKLSAMTHQEFPWKHTPNNATIPLEVLRQYFSEKFIEVKPEAIPPLTEQEKDEIRCVVEEMGKSGECDISSFR